MFVKSIFRKWQKEIISSPGPKSILVSDDNGEHTSNFSLQYYQKGEPLKLSHEILNGSFSRPLEPVVEKDAETGDFLEAAKSSLEICRLHNVPLLINDRIDIAMACDADGVHVGQSDMPVKTVRALLGPEKIIGVSCKTPEQALKAWEDGADYIGSGGVFPTNTKANNRTIGLDGLRAVCLASKLPVVAIGGINLSNARSVMELGVPNLGGVAVVSALFDRECVATETRRLRDLLTETVADVGSSHTN